MTDEKKSIKLAEKELAKVTGGHNVINIHGSGSHVNGTEFVGGLDDAQKGTMTVQGTEYADGLAGAQKGTMTVQGAGLVGTVSEKDGNNVLNWQSFDVAEND